MEECGACVRQPILVQSTEIPGCLSESPAALHCFSRSRHRSLVSGFACSWPAASAFAVRGDLLTVAKKVMVSTFMLLPVVDLQGRLCDLPFWLADALPFRSPCSCPSTTLPLPSARQLLASAGQKRVISSRVNLGKTAKPGGDADEFPLPGATTESMVLCLLTFATIAVIEKVQDKKRAKKALKAQEARAETSEKAAAASVPPPAYHQVVASSEDAPEYQEKREHQQQSALQSLSSGMQ
jgi:hypothetical protein